MTQSAQQVAVARVTRLQAAVSKTLLANRQSLSTCASIRATVSQYPLISRCEFVAIAVVQGINRVTANTQYQNVRNTMV